MSNGSSADVWNSFGRLAKRLESGYESTQFKLWTRVLWAARSLSQANVQSSILAWRSSCRGALMTLGAGAGRGWAFAGAGPRVISESHHSIRKYIAAIRCCSTVCICRVSSLTMPPREPRSARILNSDTSPASMITANGIGKPRFFFMTTLASVLFSAS